MTSAVLQVRSNVFCIVRFTTRKGYPIPPFAARTFAGRRKSRRSGHGRQPARRENRPGLPLGERPRLVTSYYTPTDPASPRSALSSEPPGTAAALDRNFNEAHILAIAQSICRYRRQAASTARFPGHGYPRAPEPAFATALEVLAANEVQVMVDRPLLHAHPDALPRHPHLQSRTQRAA